MLEWRYRRVPAIAAFRGVTLPGHSRNAPIPICGQSGRVVASGGIQSCRSSEDDPPFASHAPAPCARQAAARPAPALRINVRVARPRRPGAYVVARRAGDVAAHASMSTSPRLGMSHPESSPRVACADARHARAPSCPVQGSVWFKIVVQLFLPVHAVPAACPEEAASRRGRHEGRPPAIPRLCACVQGRGE